MLIRRDPRHLYACASGEWLEGHGGTRNRQWAEHGGGSLHDPGSMNDWSKVVAEDDRPIVGHEFGQWTFFPDFKEIGKWTGVMALKNFEIVRDDMAKKHLLDLAPISHYGPADLPNVQPVWEIKDEQGREVASGKTRGDGHIDGTERDRGFASQRARAWKTNGDADSSGNQGCEYLGNLGLPGAGESHGTG